MKEQAQARLAELKREYQLGESQLGELTRREAALRELLQRMAGAIQVLEELLAAGVGQAPDEAPAPAPGTALPEAAPDENGRRGGPAVLAVS